MCHSQAHIRKATSADVVAIRACAKLAYQRYIKRMQQTPAPMLADFDQQVAKEIVHVAVLAEEIVGYVVCYPDGDCLHLENVAVHPAHTGKGMGKKLIHFAEAHALSIGLHRIELYTNELMHENLAMYPHLGYRETARKTQSGFHRVFFSKTLSATDQHRDLHPQHR